NSRLLDISSGNFDAVIPLRMILGLCEDFKKVVVNCRQELVLLRSNTDNNALVVDDNIKTIKVQLHK
ncbi:hypothetical protein RN001_001176, partial [Aquatica leii]